MRHTTYHTHVYAGMSTSVQPAKRESSKNSNELPINAHTQATCLAQEAQRRLRTVTVAHSFAWVTVCKNARLRNDASSTPAGGTSHTSPSLMLSTCTCNLAL